MLDEKGTTTTWQDNHSGRRGHKLMTKELGDTIPAMGANENADDYDEVLAPAKLFSPYTGWNWYITEWDPKTRLCFGLVEGFETEIGYFHLTELSEVTVLGSVPALDTYNTTKHLPVLAGVLLLLPGVLFALVDTSRKGID